MDPGLLSVSVFLVVLVFLPPDKFSVKKHIGYIKLFSIHQMMIHINRSIYESVGVYIRENPLVDSTGQPILPGARALLYKRPGIGF